MRLVSRWHAADLCVSGAQRALFDRLHDIVLDTLPDARAVLSYNMPAYVTTGGRVSLSSGKTAVSLANTVAEPISAFKAKHPRFATGKVTLKFPPDADLPEDDLRAPIRNATTTSRDDGRHLPRL